MAMNSPGRQWIWVRALLALWLFLGLAAGAAAFSNKLAPGDLQTLRDLYAQDLANIEQEYHQSGQAYREQYGSRQPGAQPTMMDQAYHDAVKDSGERYLAGDTRPTEFNGLKEEFPDLVNTGSAPKNIFADQDWAADVETSNTIAQRWRAQYGTDAIEELPHGAGFVNHATDTTLWKPCQTPACKDFLITYEDSFGTTGGRWYTSNGKLAGEVQDPYGFGLDNMKKFLFADLSDDLKTMAKSVSKAGKLAEMTNDPSLTKDDVTFWKQANAITNYARPQDLIDAGIYDATDSPDVRRQKLQAWRDMEHEKMDDALQKLAAKGEELQLKRQRQLNEDKSLTDEQRQKIKDDIDKVNETNTKAEAVNEELQQKLQAKAAAGERPGAAGEGETPPKEGTAPAVPGEDSTWGWAKAQEAGAGAASGAVSAAVLSFTICLGGDAGQALWDARDADVNMRMVAGCLKDAAKGVPLAAVLGGVAALGPGGAAVVALFTAYQTGEQVVNSDLVKALQQMYVNEGGASDWAQRHFDKMTAEQFRRELIGMETKLKDFEAASAAVIAACQAAQNSKSANNAARVQQLGVSFGNSGTALVGDIKRFAAAFPSTAMFQNIVYTWRGRISAAASRATSAPACVRLTSAPTTAAVPPPAPAPPAAALPNAGVWKLTATDVSPGKREADPHSELAFAVGETGASLHWFLADLWDWHFNITFSKPPPTLSPNQEFAMTITAKASNAISTIHHGQKVTILVTQYDVGGITCAGSNIHETAVGDVESKEDKDKTVRVLFDSATYHCKVAKEPVDQFDLSIDGSMPDTRNLVTWTYRRAKPTTAWTLTNTTVDPNKKAGPHLSDDKVPGGLPHFEHTITMGETFFSLHNVLNYEPHQNDQPFDLRFNFTFTKPPTTLLPNQEFDLTLNGNASGRSARSWASDQSATMTYAASGITCTYPPYGSSQAVGVLKNDGPLVPSSSYTVHCKVPSDAPNRLVIQASAPEGVVVRWEYTRGGMAAPAQR
ncbi:MAG: hypothetical protein KGL11_12670 [Alphaproteobacteria bacterium]|nr:hypothetical protein [Alphaproteobacteria bacterium]